MKLLLILLLFPVPTINMCIKEVKIERYLEVKMNLLKLVKAKATEHSLDAYLIYAIIIKESNAAKNSLRLENGFYHKYVKGYYTNGMIDAIEAICRSCSWGLMQVMGQTARECGFEGQFPELLDPEVNIEVGCKYIKKIQKFTNDTETILLRYNGGGNKNYPKEVLELYRKLKNKGIFEDIGS